MTTIYLVLHLIGFFLSLALWSDAKSTREHLLWGFFTFLNVFGVAAAFHEIFLV